MAKDDPTVRNVVNDSKLSRFYKRTINVMRSSLGSFTAVLLLTLLGEVETQNLLKKT